MNFTQNSLKSDNLIVTHIFDSFSPFWPMIKLMNTTWRRESDFLILICHAMIYHFGKVLITVIRIYILQVNMRKRNLPRVIFLISRKRRRNLKGSERRNKTKLLSHWDEKLLLLSSRLSLFDVLLSHFRLWSSHVLETHKTAWHPHTLHFFAREISFMRRNFFFRQHTHEEIEREGKNWKHPWNLITGWRPTSATYFSVYDASIISFK